MTKPESELEKWATQRATEEWGGDSTNNKWLDERRHMANDLKEGFQHAIELLMKSGFASAAKFLKQHATPKRNPTSRRGKDD